MYTSDNVVETIKKQCPNTPIFWPINRCFIITLKCEKIQRNRQNQTIYNKKMEPKNVFMFQLMVLNNRMVWLGNDLCALTRNQNKPNQGKKRPKQLLIICLHTPHTHNSKCSIVQAISVCFTMSYTSLNFTLFPFSGKIIGLHNVRPLLFSPCALIECKNSN